ncbi:MAG: ABC transporter ATP-binding protein [Acidimicrobiia bacterium]
MLEVERLRVVYGAFTAVDGIDLQVADGEVICVLGPSGSGKSTLLRAVAGLEPAATGRVAWNSDDLKGVPPHRRGFGLMFQDHALFPHRDVLGNVEFGLRMQGQPRSEIDRRARESLALVGMDGFEQRRIAELSGGEQQRVALARALAAAPRLLMLDEPLGALDRTLRDHLVTELRALFVRLGLSILFVTHDHDEAFALADRLVVMHEGRIEQAGTPTEIWQHPGNAFVARFLGWNVTGAFGGGLLAARPDHIRIAPDGVASLGWVPGRVTARTFRRDHFLMQVEVGDPQPVQVAVPLSTLEVPDVGDEIGLALEPGAAVPIGQ